MASIPCISMPLAITGHSIGHYQELSASSISLTLPGERCFILCSKARSKGECSPGSHSWDRAQRGTSSWSADFAAHQAW